MNFILGNEVEKKVEEVNVEGAVEEATAVLTQCLEERCGVRASQPGTSSDFFFFSLCILFYRALIPKSSFSPFFLFFPFFLYYLLTIFLLFFSFFFIFLIIIFFRPLTARSKILYTHYFINFFLIDTRYSFFLFYESFYKSYYFF